MEVQIVWSDRQKKEDKTNILYNDSSLKKGNRFRKQAEKNMKPTEYDH